MKLSMKEDRLDVIDVYSKNWPFKILQTVHCGESFKNIFILTVEGKVLFSNNYGKKWENIIFKLSHQKDGFIFEEVYANPKDKNHLVFIEDNGTHFETRSCDNSINPILEGNKLKNFSFNPHNKNYIMTNYYENCIEKKDDCQKTLLLKLSIDQGKTWKDIYQNITEFIWNLGYANEKNHIRIYFIENLYKKKVLKFTDNFFSSSKTIFEDVISMELSRNLIYISANKNPSHYVSDTFSALDSFYPLKFDKILGKNHIHVFLKSKFKGLNYLVTISKINELEVSTFYYSDNLGHNFQSLLDYVVCDHKTTECDIYFVKSIDGVIIANIYDIKIINKLKNVKKKDMDNLFYIENFEKLPSSIQTLISYDYGKSWNSLKKPKYNSKNKAYNCNNCNLNLFISETKKIYKQKGIISKKFSPGIILSEGTVGKYLADLKNNTGLYISDDGGLNWREILTGEYIYTFIDQGGIILAADKNKKVNTLLFSTDYGVNWKNITISTKPIFVSNIIINSLEKENKFLIEGKSTENSTNSIVITVDLKNYHENQCEYNEDSEKSDYDIFSPYLITKNDCYNGRIINFLRKKPNKNCYIKNSEDLVIVKKICKCTEEDWRCSFGYFKDKNGKCTPMTKDNIDADLFINNFESFKKWEEQDKCINTTHKRNPYTKNNQSYCNGGIDYGKEFITCSSKFIFPIYPILLYIISIVLFIILLFSIKNKFSNNQNLKNLLNKSMEIFTKKKSNNEESMGIGNIINREDNIFNNDKLFEVEEEDSNDI